MTKRLRKILRREQKDMYTQEQLAVFFVKKECESITDAKEDAIKHIKKFMKKFGDNWTHFALWEGNPWGKGKQLTPIVAIP